MQEIANKYFEAMKANGFFSENKSAGNYIGNFMYMGVNDGFALFKHINFRSYLKIATILIEDLNMTTNKPA